MVTRDAAFGTGDGPIEDYPERAKACGGGYQRINVAFKEAIQVMTVCLYSAA